MRFNCIAYKKNCYSIGNRSVMIGGAEIQSIEGTTQGNSAAMVNYVINDSHVSGKKLMI